MTEARVPHTREDERFFNDRGFGLRMGFGKKPALLVIGFVNALTDASTMLGSKLDRQLQEANRPIDAAHERGVPVFFSTVSSDEEELRDAGIGALKHKGTRLLVAGISAVAHDVLAFFAAERSWHATAKET
jgi:maleamate amidohydrolase